MNSTLSKLIAILRRDLLTTSRRSLGFGLLLFAALIELATFYFLSQAIGKNYRPEGTDYFWFLLVGTAFIEFMFAGVRSFISNIREAQISGLMEVLMTTSTPAVTFLMLETVSSLCGRMVYSLFYVTLAVTIFRVHRPDPNLIGTFVVFCLSFLLAISTGIIVAAFQIWLQKGDSVVTFLGIAVGLFSGVFFSTSTLPGWLQFIAQINPFAHALTAFRWALLGGASLRTLEEPIFIIAVYCAVAFPSGIALLSFALRRARSTGSLMFY